VDYETLVVTTKDRIAVIELNQPDRLNPLDPLSSEGELTDALTRLSHDPDVWVAVLTGRGRAFSVGADLRNKPTPRSDWDATSTMPQRLAYDYSYGLVWKTLYEFNKPIIAAVNGYALGGGWELAHLCDFIVAADNAVFGAIEVELGLNPFAMSTNYLPKMVGKHLAMDLVLNARRLTAQECLDLHLVNKVVPKDELMDAAMALAGELAARPPLTMALAKRLIHRAMKVDEDYELERAFAYLLRSTDDTKAAWAAAVDRSGTPEYTGR
jgi:enoyl-CoA hydratase